MPYVQRHNPIIVSRVEFLPATPPSLPSIASRIEFSPERLAFSEREAVAGQVVESRTGSSQTDVPGPVPRSTSQPNNHAGPQAVCVPPAHSRPGRIPKPAGEPGRPGSGGYCVENVLIHKFKWSKETVIEQAVRTEARNQLDMTLSYRRQNPETISAICNAMVGRWPILNEYVDCWPVRSMLKLTLKYAAEASRRVIARQAHERLRAALRGTSP